MPSGAKLVQAAIGFRVKSGWATAVLISGPPESPQLLDRRVIDLSDPAVPDSKQPYHAVLELAEKDASKMERHLRGVVERFTSKSVKQLLKKYDDAGHAVAGIGLVVGSLIDPATIKNDHIRAHALEGRLFRSAIEEAARACGLGCLVVVERNAFSKGATVLNRSEAELKREITNLGRTASGRWRMDEKTAALAAWMTLL
jgi:hypothetical protein